MKNPVRLTAESELRSLMTETFINTTKSVTKITDNSVLAAIIAANAKVGKKALKDIALSVSHLFPDLSTGQALDNVADKLGISPRKGSSQSSTYVRFVGSQGTSYVSGVNTVSGSNGVVFDLQESGTIGSKGYVYLKVRSQLSGSFTNVDPYTIVNINPVPSGHVGVINEYAATGGRDIEQDDVFLARIKKGANSLSRGTLDYLTQVFIQFNPNVLRVDFNGIDNKGKSILSITTQNGMNLTSFELDQLLSQSGPYLSLCDLNPIGTLSYGVKLQNVEYYPIDVAMRLELLNSYNIGDVAKEIQVKFSKYVDFRFWDHSVDKIEWDVLLSIVRNTPGVKQVLDNYFTPNQDITIPRGKLPRFRGFVAYDLNGNILLNQSGTLNPIFYPNEIVDAFVTTVI